MHSTANTPYIGTIDHAPHGGTCLSVPRLPFKGSQIVLNYIPAGIQICVELKTAHLTHKVRLVLPVPSGYVPTPATPLRCIVCIYIDYLYTFSPCFIFYKPLELSKVPAVYPLPVLLTCFYSPPYPLKLLKNYHTASRNELYYILCHLMVDCSPKPFLLPRELLEMPFDRGGAFGLQTLSKSLIPLRYSPHMPSIKELVYLSIRGRNYSKLTESKVNSYEEVFGFYLGNILFYGYVKEELLKLLVVFEVCGCKLPVKVLLEVFRNFYLEPLSSLDSGKGNFLSIQPNCIRTFIVTYGRIVALRAFAFESFSLSLYGGLEAFCSHNPCGDNELSRKKGFILDCAVSEFVEFNTIPKFSFPTDFADVIVGKLVLLNGLKKYLFLLFCRFEDEFKGSLEFHIHILLKYLQTFKSALFHLITEGGPDSKEDP